MSIRSYILIKIFLLHKPKPRWTVKMFFIDIVWSPLQRLSAEFKNGQKMPRETCLVGLLEQKQCNYLTIIYHSLRRRTLFLHCENKSRVHTQTVSFLTNGGCNSDCFCLESKGIDTINFLHFAMLDSEITNKIIHNQFKLFQLIMSYTENGNYDVTLAMRLDKENTYN